MPALKNQRHEKFALALFEGKSASEAYVLAGYRECRQNASRLMAKDDIQRRLAELQGGAEATAKVTIESIKRELDQAVEVARANRQAQPMVSAATMKAKLAGLMVERVEHGAPGDFDNCPTVASIADKTLKRLVEQFCPIDEADRAAYHALIDRHLQEQEEFIAVLKARPITGSRVDTRNLKTPWEQLPAYSPPRISKGSGTKPA